MDKDVILVGGFHEVIELCEKAGYNIVGIIDSHLHDSYMKLSYCPICKKTVAHGIVGEMKSDE